MNRETYLTKKAALQAQIETLKQEYIQARAKYQIGDKLRLTDRYNPNGVNVIVFAVLADDSGEIRYSLRKLKKDGTEGLNSIHYYSPYKFEKL